MGFQAGGISGPWGGQCWPVVILMSPVWRQHPRPLGERVQSQHLSPGLQGPRAHLGQPKGQKAWVEDDALWGGQGAQSMGWRGGSAADPLHRTAFLSCYLGPLRLRACPGHLVWQEGGLGPCPLAVLWPLVTSPR